MDRGKLHGCWSQGGNDLTSIMQSLMWCWQFKKSLGLTGCQHLSQNCSRMTQKCIGTLLPSRWAAWLAQLIAALFCPSKMGDIWALGLVLMQKQRHVRITSEALVK